MHKLREHLHLEELADEHGEAKTLTLCAQRSIPMSTGPLHGSGLLGDPFVLEAPLTAVEKVLVEELTAGDGLTIGVLDPVVVHVQANLLYHLPAQTSVHLEPRRLVHRLLEDEMDDLDEHPAVLLLLRPIRPRDDLARNAVESFHSELVEERLDIPVDNLRRLRIDGLFCLDKTCRCPAISRNL